MMLEERTMNKMTSPPHIGGRRLAVTVSPWPLRWLPEIDATTGMKCRVDEDGLILQIDPSEKGLPALAALRALLDQALAILPADAVARIEHAAIELDRERLAATLACWTETEVPVHSLVGFDFAVPGNPRGARSIGLAALAGQEVEAFPPDEADRAACARMVVRLAHDVLVNGPVIEPVELPAPDTIRGKVWLLPREEDGPVVQIRFN